MRTKTDTLYNAVCGDDLAPGGIPRTRLDWLCQPEQIEQTLHLLSSLNHWIKARERLLYADRQGLYHVKAAVVRQAFASGLLRPVAYIDGSAGFAVEFSLELAADIATEVFIERLAMLIEDDEYLPDDEDEIDSVALRLFARITGRRPGSRVDIEALDVEGTKAFLQERLAALIAQARSSRQPIPEGELAALCVEPVDLLDIRWSRNRPSPRWSELDEREAVQLDPEGLSLIAFEYASATAHFIFHLPFRVAEGFVPEPLVRDLRSRPADSREGGEFFGRAITEEEGQQHPLEDILRELGVESRRFAPTGSLTNRYMSASWRAGIPIGKAMRRTMAARRIGGMKTGRRLPGSRATGTRGSEPQERALSAEALPNQILPSASSTGGNNTTSRT